MWYLTLHRWIGDRDEAINTSLDDHLAWMREQQLAGKVLFSGPASTANSGSSSSVTCPEPNSTTCAATNRSSPADTAVSK